MTAAEYHKAMSAKATVGESAALAHSAVRPVVAGVRFALVLSVVACGIASIALAMAIR